MLRERFFADLKDGTVEMVQPERFLAMWNKVTAFENLTGTRFGSGFSKQNYVDLLAYMQIRHASTLPSVKSILYVYLKYMYDHEAATDEDLRIFRELSFDDLIGRTNLAKLWYRSIADLIDCVEDTVAQNSNSYDTTSYDPTISALVLAWYGFTDDQIIRVKRTDVTEDGVVLNGETIRMDRTAAVYLKRLAQSSGYYQQARGLIFHTYAESDYLLRSERYGQFEITRLRQRVSEFNKLSVGRYALRLDVVRKSGIFNRAMIAELSGEVVIDEDTDADVLSRLFCTDVSTSRKRLHLLRDYGMYREMFV